MFQTYMDTIFENQEMTDSINEYGILWGRVLASGLFGYESVATTQILIDRTENGLTLLPHGERGAEGKNRKKPSDDAVLITIPHIPHQDVVTPDDVQNKRRPGTDEEAQVADAVTDSLEGMARNHSITAEFMALSSLKGVLMDGEGTVLYDYFDTFGKEQPDPINLQLDNANTDVISKFRGLSRAIMNSAVGDTVTGVGVYVPGDVWDDLYEHPKFKENLLNHTAALRRLTDKYTGTERDVIEIGGCRIEEYSASAPKAGGGVQEFLDEGTAYAFPLGTTNTFREVEGPAYALSQVNTAPSSDEAESSRLFVTAEELKHGMGVEMKAQANRLFVCKQPHMLRKLVKQ